MILTKAILMQLERVEQGVPDDVANRAIMQTEDIIAQVLGDKYATATAWASTDARLVGGIVNGTYFCGLRVAAAELAFVMLALDNIVLTGFGTVRKTDEYSEHADFINVCKAKENHAYQTLRRLCDLQGWAYNRPDTTYTTERFFA